ncbi:MULTISPECIES: transfer repressor [Buttiauxella]|uniref:HtdA n=1 Tax=Buttiauxella agrestis TaxID=82977 RepID=A0A381KQM5_9ENTR|nr:MULTISPECIES: transfer repressor [Buttiauxella]TDX12071.1 hypothetical protein EDF88_4669 [Buttiauxella sp. BIGb0552]SUY92796.1 Uncharacterised protein [Buttiauxella agrestis]
MLSRNSLIHGLRRNELIEVLNASDYPIVHKDNSFTPEELKWARPVLFDIDELHISIAPLSSVKYDWDMAPVDTILIEVIVPALDTDLVEEEDSLLRDSGVGYILYEPAGASIRRTVTFVGGVTPDNMLYQLHLMLLSALHLLHEDVGDDS